MSDAVMRGQRIGLRIPRRALRALYTAGMFVASLALSLTVGEYFLRWYEPHLRVKHTAGPLKIYESNPSGQGSMHLKPRLDLTTWAGSQTVRVTTNSRGMRWRETPLEKPPGKTRVAFFGDSFTFGCWADSVENSLVGVFERQVSKAVEALNFGTPGYGIDDSELLLRERGLAFDPDYVVLVVFNGNDFRDTYLGIDRFDVADGTAGLEGKRLEKLVPPEFRRGEPARGVPLRSSSQMTRWLQRFALYRFLAPFLGWQERRVEFRPSKRFTSYSFWSRVPYPAVAKKAVELSLASVRRMAKEARAHHARFGIVAIPYWDQVYSSQPAGRDFDISLPQLHLQLFARDRSIPYLDLLPILRDYVAKHNVDLYLNPDPHFNTLGHRIAGEAIANWFRCCLKEQPDEPDVEPMDDADARDAAIPAAANDSERVRPPRRASGPPGTSRARAAPR